MSDIKFRLVFFAGAVFLSIMFAVWVNSLDPAPAPSPSTQIKADDRTVFIVNCTKASGLGLQMRAVCGCIYDNVQNGESLGDDLSERCLREHSDILE